MRKTASNNDLMTTHQAGEMLGVAVRTVQLWVEAGTLPAWRTAGGHRRIPRSAVEKLVHERAQACAVAIEPVPHAGPLKLLIVEDDPIQTRMLRRMIETWNHPVTLVTACNGFEGLVRIGQSQPDWVVTDLQMPGMDGFEMLRFLQQKGSGLDALRVVVVSALSEADIAQRGGLPPGVVFLPKPLHLAKLQAVVLGG
jgi:excisionase family DNA binding protein